MYRWFFVKWHHPNATGRHGEFAEMKVRYRDVHRIHGRLDKLERNALVADDIVEAGERLNRLEEFAMNLDRRLRRVDGDVDHIRAHGRRQWVFAQVFGVGVGAAEEALDELTESVERFCEGRRGVRGRQWRYEDIPERSRDCNLPVDVVRRSSV